MSIFYLFNRKFCNKKLHNSKLFLLLYITAHENSINKTLKKANNNNKKKNLLMHSLIRYR